nr:MAG TPA: Protein of unknown function (DUF551) [Caudoviricetes sp.]
MKQTLEEVANEIGGVHPDWDKITCFRIGFKEGARWQSKQSPWISVNERLPEPNKEVLLYDKNSIRHYVIGWLRRDKGYNKGMWALSNGWIEDKDITHWMPIDKPITE